MMKRTIWFAAGAASTIYTQRKLKQKVDEITPASVAVEAAKTAGKTAGKVGVSVARRVGDALTEGSSPSRSRTPPPRVRPPHPPPPLIPNFRRCCRG